MSKIDDLARAADRAPVDPAAAQKSTIAGTIWRLWARLNAQENQTAALARRLSALERAALRGRPGDDIAIEPRQAAK